ncbi:hypothetical protein CPT76_23390 [Paenibacillus sp. AR247]|nr:hypothetical protein CPT76_23390 [Paenibacillus sp. AR247]
MKAQGIWVVTREESLVPLGAGVFCILGAPAQYLNRVSQQKPHFVGLFCVHTEDTGTPILERKMNDG